MAETKPAPTPAPPPEASTQPVPTPPPVSNTLPADPALSGIDKLKALVKYYDAHDVPDTHVVFGAQYLAVTVGDLRLVAGSVSVSKVTK